MSSKPGKDEPAAKSAKSVSPAPAQPAQPRLRVLAGPNGSGKSTIKPELRPEWIGVFVNADEMEKDLKASGGHLKLGALGVTGKPEVVLRRIKKSLKTFGLEQRLDLLTLLAGMTKKPKNRVFDNSLVLAGGDNGEWTPHDLRRTSATTMQRLGIPNDLIDRCQNHVLGGPAVRRHYLLYDFAAEKRAAWEKLGNHLDIMLNLTSAC